MTITGKNGRVIFQDTEVTFDQWELKLDFGNFEDIGCNDSRTITRNITGYWLREGETLKDVLKLITKDRRRESKRWRRYQHQKRKQ